MTSSNWICNSTFLFILILVFCNIAIRCEQQALMFGEFNSIGVGFAVMSNYTGQPVAYPNSPLRGEISPTSTLQITQVGNTIVVVGEMEYLNDIESGGILLYNIDSGQWSTLSVPDLFQGQTIYGVAHFPSLGTKVFLIGDFQSTTRDVNNPLQQVALCDIISSSCQSLGDGISDPIDALTGIVEWGGGIAVAYISNGTYVVNLWDSFGWQKILAIPEATPSSNSIIGAYAGVFLISTGFGVQQSIINTGFSCPNITTPLAIYAGTCWYPLSAWNIGDAQEVECMASIGGLTCVLYSTVSGNFTISCQNSGVSNPFVPVTSSPQLRCPLDVTEDYVYVGYSESPTTKMKINILNGSSQFLQYTSCNKQPSCTISNSTFWCECSQYSEILLSSYNETSASYSTLDGLYAILPELDTMCASGDYIYASGSSMSSAGNLTTANRFSIWNGTQWTVPSLENLESQTPVCYSNTSLLWLGYINGSSIVLVTIDTTLETTSYSSIPFKCNASVPLNLLGIVDNYMFFQCDGLIRVYDMIQGNLANYTFNIQNVTCLMGQNGKVYFGGQFIISEEIFTTNIAMYDLDTRTWIPMLSVDSAVNEMVMVQDKLYIVGGFTTVDRVPVNGIIGYYGNGTWFDDLGGGVAGVTLTEIIYVSEQNALYCIDQNGKLYVYRFTSQSQTSTGTWPPLVTENQIQMLDTVVLITPQPVPSAPSKSKSKNSAGIYFAVSITVAATFLATIIATGVIIVVRRQLQKKRRMEPFRQLERMPMIQNDYKANLRTLLSDKSVVKIREEDITILGVIGHGGQGLVQKAKWKGTEVAIKSVAGPLMDEEEVSLFTQEIRVLSLMNHKNIVRFIGVMVSKKDSKIHLVTELMDTDLKTVISILNLGDKIRVAKAIASAMKYLHSQKLFHRDIKPGNVLLSKDGRCKITDFGLTRLAPDNTMTITQNRGTVTYMAPEVMMTGHYNEKADVYSYGILLAELIGNKHPFSHVALDWSFLFMQKFTRKEITPQLPTDCPEALYKVMEKCVSWDPEERPSFDEIHAILKTAQNQFNSLQ